MLGIAQRWSNTAGVFRVTDNLARALINSGKCSLNFSASELEWHYYALKYVQESPAFQGIGFPHSVRRYEAFSRWQEANHRAAAADASGLSKIRWRMARKLLRHSTYTMHPQLISEASLNSADVFHSPYFAIPSRVSARKNLSAFITVHDLIGILYPQYFERSSQNQQHALKQIIGSIQNKDWVVCVSKKTKEDLCNYRKDLDPRRVFVTHLGASDWFYPCQDTAKIKKMRSKYKIPAGRYLLSVCTFEPRKNLTHLIRCFSQLVQQESLKDLQLVLVGGLGWKYESIFSELAGTDKAIQEHIILAGRVADEDMAALYSEAIAFVYPSLYEGFGLPP